MKALIIGSKGFVGQHLKRELKKQQGWQVFGYNLRDGENVLDYETLRERMNVLRPDRIYHLAAQAYVPESFTYPKRVFEVNVAGSINLLEVIRQLGLKPKIMLAGTSEEYGDAQYGDGIITEDTKPNPLSPYAISKLAMDHLGQLYAKSYGMHVVVTRAFNHTGAGRGEMYAESSFAKQIAEIEAGHREILEHGNLKPIRNYSDVRDVVRAYVMAIDLPPGVYNICSDQNVSMSEILEILITQSKTTIKTKVNPSLYRPSDFSFKTPSCKEFTKRTGWRPEYKLEETMESLLDYWRERV